jgi:hypothetical protein
MRTLLIVSGLILLAGPARLLGQSAPSLPKPSPTVGNSSPDARRAPAVVWRRGMSETVPQPVPEVEASLPKPEIPEPRVPAPSRRPSVTAPPIPLLKAIQPVSHPPSVRAREQLMKELSALHAGAPRTEVFAKLGQPAYSIGMPDGSHYIERCRFRMGMENLASIEMRDGYVIAIDRIAH